MLDWLKSRIIEFASWLYDLVIEVIYAFLDMLGDLASWLFEGMLDIAMSALSQLDLSGLQGVAAWGDLPSEIINVLGLLGVGEAGAIIVSAIGIRLLLQLVPFTRLGS